MKHSIKKIFLSLNAYMLFVMFASFIFMMFTLERQLSFDKIQILNAQKSIILSLTNLKKNDLELALIQFNGKTAQLQSEIEKLYNIYKYSFTEKYILDNQEVMRRITQQVLNRVARVNLKDNLNVNRSNVVEFYLHPNGDMTDFKFLSTSGYYVLDDTTKETIEYAYSRYPRPTEKTLIRYNVFYNLARY